MKVAMQAKQQKGFTIIELVVVILLLGILAATALPRFLDVTEEAHDSVVVGTASALQTGMALYRAQWLAQQQPAAGQALGTEFNGLRTASTGFPIDLAANTASTGTFSTTAGDANLQCAGIYNGILQAGRAPVSVSPLTDNAVPASPAVETAANSDLFEINSGFVAKMVTGATSIGALAADSLAAGDQFCVYVYAADAGRRVTGSGNVPAIVYFPRATNGTSVANQFEAGTVVRTAL